MNVKDYLDLPYHIVIQRLNDESGSYYFATVREFDGYMSHGDTYEEAFRNIREAMELWIEGKLDGGFPVPEPIDESQYSGKFVLRLPKTLHARLAQEAEKEGVSLNQYGPVPAEYVAATSPARADRRRIRSIALIRPILIS